VIDYLQEMYQFTLPVVEENSAQLIDAQKSDDRENPDELKVYVFKK
jgi:hypothetical protein